MKKLLYLLVFALLSTTIYSFEYSKIINNSDVIKVTLNDDCHIYGTIYVDLGGDEPTPVHFDITDNSCSEAWAFLDEMISDIMAQFDNKPAFAPNPGN